MDFYNKPSPEATLFLAHHGILGQKWGKRNGPPYPLDESDKSSREKRLAREGKKSYNKKKEGSGGERKGLTDKQKRAIKIGAAAAVTAIAAIGIYELNKHGKLDGLKDLGKSKVDELLGKKGNRNVEGFTEDADFRKQSVKRLTSETGSQSFQNGFRKLARPETAAEAVKNVNPSGSGTNCRACSIASILRMRGMDVEALGSVQGGQLRDAVEECFKGANVAEIYSPSKERISNYILKRYGEGSSGAMSARYRTPAGKPYEHAISWAVENGSLSFFDGQKKLSDAGRYLDLLASDGSAEIARLDNLELNPEGLKKYVKGR